MGEGEGEGSWGGVGKEQGRWAVEESNRGLRWGEGNVSGKPTTLWHRTGAGGGRGGLRGLAGSSDRMWPERNLTEGMQHNEINRQH